MKMHKSQKHKITLHVYVFRIHVVFKEWMAKWPRPLIHKPTIMSSRPESTIHALCPQGTLSPLVSSRCKSYKWALASAGKVNVEEGVLTYHSNIINKRSLVQFDPKWPLTPRWPPPDPLGYSGVRMLHMLYVSSSCNILYSGYQTLKILHKLCKLLWPQNDLPGPQLNSPSKINIWPTNAIWPQHDLHLTP